MPNTKISALTAGNPAQGTDEIPIARGAANFKVTAASIAALSPAGTVTSVGGTGTVNGITLTGTVTSAGDLTLGGTLSGVSLTTQVTGTLPLANGGTGQTTKAAAFNALSPVSATGDLIIGNGVNSNTRLAIGSFNQYLRSNGTTASWANVSVSASDIAGTLQPYQGGTGTSTGPTSNGQLLIGNGFGGYNVNTLTAGAGVTITNGSGTITIAASGGGGATINNIFVSTSLGIYSNSSPGGGSPRPLIGFTDTGPSQYGAFFFPSSSSGYGSFITINSLQIQDTDANFFNYTSGPDFFGSGFSINSFIAGCYGINLYTTSLKTLFSDSSNALDANSLKPVDASSGPSSVNPQISLFMSGGPSYSNGSGGRAVLVSYVGAGGPGSYELAFASGDINPATNFSTGYTVSGISFQINGSLQSYSSGIDYNVSFWSNDSNEQFVMTITPSNPSLTTLLDNSSLGA